jgi:hypothetical protein
MPKDDPFISHGQREYLYHRTHNPYWREKDEITKEEAGQMFARLRRQEKKAKIAMNMSDWLKLDPKDKSAALQEQGDKITTMEFGKVYASDVIDCSESLLELRNWLKAQIEDEHNAFSQYNEAAAKMTHFVLPTWATAIHSMASDELNHAGILQIIVDVITEKCGE